MNKQENSAENLKPPRSIFRFGIRTLLVLALLVAVTTAWISHARHQTFASQRVLQKLRSFSGDDAEIIETYTYQFAESGQWLGPSAQPPAIAAWKKWIYGEELGRELRYLKIDRLHCEDIDFLEELTKLDHLNLMSLKELKSLNGVPSSVEYFDVRYSPKLSSLEGLRNAANLKSAGIFGCDEIDDFQLLGEFSQLSTVHVHKCDQISNLDWASKLPLEQLYLQSNKNLDNIDGLANHPTLKGLEITYGGKISNLDPIGTLLELSGLKITVEHSDNIDFLCELTKLQSLDITHFELKDFSKLSKLKSLEMLDLTSCRVLSWKGIDQLTSLKEIRLINASVESWEGLVQVPSLKRFDIFNSPIPKDHSPLKVLQGLDTFSIESGKANAEELEKLKPLLPNTVISYPK